MSIKEKAKELVAGVMLMTAVATTGCEDKQQTEANQVKQPTSITKTVEALEQEEKTTLVAEETEQVQETDTDEFGLGSNFSDDEKTFWQDFVERCAKDKNCACTEDKNGNTTCEKHITKPILTWDVMGRMFSETEFLLEKEMDYIAHDITGDEEKRTVFVRVMEKNGAKFVFDDIKIVPIKMALQCRNCASNNGCQRLPAQDRDKCYQKCAKAAMSEDPQELCLATYPGAPDNKYLPGAGYPAAKYEKGICKITFGGKITEPGSIGVMRARSFFPFGECTINKVIEGKGNTATGYGSCNGVKAELNLINYQVQNKGR